MDDEELALVKTYILQSYDEFVGKVAAGRDLSEERVRELGEGRVWMGGDAIEHGLVDRFGSLQDAIRLARAEAGIPDDLEIELVEYPPRPLINWAALFGRDSLPRGLPFGLSQPLAAIWEHTLAGRDRLDAAEPGDGPVVHYEEAYLGQLAAHPGRPQAMVPPEILPEGWRRLD
jgi:protease-4